LAERVESLISQETTKWSSLQESSEKKQTEGAQVFQASPIPEALLLRADKVIE
jgi:hypothetical protein